MKVIININDSDIMGTLTLLRLASKEYAGPELDKTAEQCKGKTFEMTPEDFGEDGTALKVALCALCLGKCHDSGSGS